MLSHCLIIEKREIVCRFFVWESIYDAKHIPIASD